MRQNHLVSDDKHFKIIYHYHSPSASLGALHPNVRAVVVVLELCVVELADSVLHVVPGVSEISMVRCGVGQVMSCLAATSNRWRTGQISLFIGSSAFHYMIKVNKMCYSAITRLRSPVAELDDPLSGATVHV
jgi:hypothetical protein